MQQTFGFILIDAVIYDSNDISISSIRTRSIVCDVVYFWSQITPLFFFTIVQHIWLVNWPRTVCIQQPTWWKVRPVRFRYEANFGWVNIDYVIRWTTKTSWIIVRSTSLKYYTQNSNIHNMCENSLRHFCCYNILLNFVFVYITFSRMNIKCTEHF